MTIENKINVQPQLEVPFILIKLSRTKAKSTVLLYQMSMVWEANPVQTYLISLIILEVCGCSIYSKITVWLILQIVFQLQVTYKLYRQVLTPVNNSQLLLKLEILDKLRLVTFHKNTTQRKHNILTGSILFRRNGSSNDLEPQSVDVTMLAT